MENETPKTVEERLEELQRRLQEQEISHKNELATLRRDNMMLLSTRAAPAAAPAAPAEVPQLDLSGLPDPLVDGDGYHRAMAARYTQYHSALEAHKRRQEAEEAQQAAPADALWEEFQEKHPDLAKDPDKVLFAVQKVREKMAKRGVDERALVTVYGDQFMADVAAEHARIFGAAKPVEAEPAPYDPYAELRTSVFGGNEAGGKVAGKAEPPPTDFATEMKDWQRSAGIL